jgi:flagellar biosynthesis/type III secretory pathway protein FliH
MEYGFDLSLHKIEIEHFKEMEKQQKQISYADGYSEGYKRATELAKWGITKKIKG